MKKNYQQSLTVFEEMSSSLVLNRSDQNSFSNTILYYCTKIEFRATHPY